MEKQVKPIFQGLGGILDPRQMQGQEILNELFKFNSIKQFCKGIVSIDTIPRRFKNKEFVVINTEPSSEQGQHWFCLLKVKTNQYEIFDSLGFDEQKINLFKQYVKFPNCTFKFNSTRVQSPSSQSCGLFVIYFIVQRLHNFDLKFEDLLNDVFSDNTEFNENSVTDFFKD